MVFSENTKQSVLNDLRSKGFYDSPVKSAYFEQKYKLQGPQVRDLINELIDDERIKDSICSNGKGYYIARNLSESLHGLNTIKSRRDKLDDRLSKMLSKHSVNFENKSAHATFFDGLGF